MKKMRMWYAKALAAWLIAALLVPCAVFAEEATTNPPETATSVPETPTNAPETPTSVPETATAEPEEAPTDAPTTPEATAEETPEISLIDEGWEALPGQTIALALPYSYAFGETRLTSNEYLWQDEQGASLIELSYEDWLSGRYPGAFTGEIAGALAEVEVRLLAGEDASYLFGLTGDLSSRPVNGAFLSAYALFEGLTIRHDATPGAYRLRFEIYYTDRVGHTNRGGEPIRERVTLVVGDGGEVTPNPDETPVPSESPMPTDSPEPTDAPDPEAGKLMLGEVRGTPEFSAKKTGSLQVPMSFVLDATRVYSNRDDSGNYVPWARDAAYGGEILSYIEYLALEVTPEMAADIS